MKFDKSTLQKILLPLSVLGILLIVYVAWRFFGLPPEEEVLAIARTYFNKYGYSILLISAIIEGLVLVGWYYPGSLVIFLGVILAGDDIGNVVKAVSVITVGLLISYVANFFLGRYGWYKLLLKFGLREPLEDAKDKVEKHGLKAIFMSYWQPNLAALVAASAGILDFSFKKFLIYSVIAAVLWNSFWGIVVYLVGENALSLVGLRFVLFIMFVWIVYRIWKQDKKEEAPEINIP